MRLINTIKWGFLVMVVSISLVACDTDKDESIVLKGDLDYPRFRIANLYNQPDSLIDKFKHSLDSIGHETVMKEDSVFMTSYMTLKEHDLLKSPFIYLKIDSLPSVIVYMNPEDYEPFTQFTHADLVQNQQKVVVKLKAHKLYNILYLCDGVQSIEVVHAEIPFEKNKFKIEDYR